MDVLGLHGFGYARLRKIINIKQGDVGFVGQWEVFVCLDFVHFFFPLAAKLIGL